MRRSLLAAALGAPLLLILALIGCGPPKDVEDAGSTDTGGGPATTNNSGTLQALSGKPGAVLKGTVTIKGMPDADAANAQYQNAIRQKQDQFETCYTQASPAERSQQIWVLDGQGHVGNVVVWIQPPAGSFFTVDPKEVKLEPFELKQPHCAFIPHVAWVAPFFLDPSGKPIPSGQTFSVSNTAPVSHNTKWDSDSFKGELGTLASGTAPQPVALKGNNVLVRFSCNIHTWMDAYVWVFNHPYAAVTDEHGHYEIKNVPAGSKVRLTAWHESLLNGPNKGFLTKSKIKGDEIALAGDETVRDLELDLSK